MFGGNSNWRGPVWMPFNYLLIEAHQKFGHYYGDSLKVEFPTRSGNWINLWDASLELEKRLVGLFRRNEAGQRPFNGAVELFKAIPIGRICCSSTSTFAAITAPVLAPAINRMDRRFWKTHPTAALLRWRCCSPPRPTMDKHVEVLIIGSGAGGGTLARCLASRPRGDGD